MCGERQRVPGDVAALHRILQFLSIQRVGSLQILVQQPRSDRPAVAESVVVMLPEVVGRFDRLRNVAFQIPRRHSLRQIGEPDIEMSFEDDLDLFHTQTIAFPADSRMMNSHFSSRLSGDAAGLRIASASNRHIVPPISCIG
ncbi:hypothetical protein SDC9_157056 [bioreactor metagenome]|uniref:Uncharacterized protein n=1 Tax=bioreactor metagenome TaxID=1076179 RepID=A0A645FB32_9ZZZZ